MSSLCGDEGEEHGWEAQGAAACSTQVACAFAANRLPLPAPQPLRTGTAVCATQAAARELLRVQLPMLSAAQQDLTRRQVQAQAH